MLRRSLLAAPALLAAPRMARADTWPSRPITIIVPRAAGSTAEIFARIVSVELAATFGQQSVVEGSRGAARPQRRTAKSA